MHSAATSTVRLCATLTLGRARASAAAIHLSSATHNGHRRHGTRKKIGLFTKANVHERKKTIDELVVPQTVRRPKNGVVLEFDGMENVSREAKGSKLDEFYRKPIMRQMAVENHMNSRLYQKAYTDFRSYCLDAPLDAALQVTFCDIINSSGSELFPHLESIDDLRLISDLTQPHNWSYEQRKNISSSATFYQFEVGCLLWTFKVAG
ncbi:hypothetical protein QR680_003397 [Steinernema hermaphroditum]|uniref:Suv3 N-terminal domain-containing protein n=1 Tax=Steinernema hermaphroditum TaxID=289476 RepID=A0AA39H8R0_9BILA|nr:hypothetical protein QR680_003397 [Steinernema hermaphroditum]